MTPETISERRSALVKSRILQIQTELSGAYAKISELCRRQSASKPPGDKLPEISALELTAATSEHLGKIKDHPIYPNIESAQIVLSAQKKALQHQSEINHHFMVTEELIELPKSPLRRNSSENRSPTSLLSAAPTKFSFKKKFPRFKPLRLKRKRARKDMYEMFAWQLKVAAKPLNEYLVSCKKAVLTRDWQAAREEIKQVKLCGRIDSMKKDQVWEMRQLAPSYDPERPKTHWDHVLDEMKWMQTDFRQERKWKLAMCYHLAHQVMKWHQAEDKSSLCVKRKPTNPVFLTPPQEFAETQADTFPASDSMEVDSAVFKHVESQDVMMAEPPTSEQPAKASAETSSSSSLTIFSVSAGIQISVSTDCPILQDCPLYEPFPEDFTTYTSPVGNIIPIGLPMTQVVHVRVNHAPPDSLLFQDLDTSRSHAKDGTVPLFIHAEEEDLESTSGKPIKGIIKTASDRDMAEWSTQEEEILLQLWQNYGSNWQFIAEVLNADKCLRDNTHSPWECYARFCRLNQLEPSVNGSVTLLKSELQTRKSTTWQAAQEERTQQMKRMFSTFEFIKKCAKRRDSQKNPVPPMPKKINLTAHETHLQSQIQAGVNPNGPVMTPIELSVIKERRDKELRQAQGQALANLAYNRGMMGRPGMPYQQQFRPGPRPATPGASGSTNTSSQPGQSGASHPSSVEQSGQASNLMSTPAPVRANSTAPGSSPAASGQPHTQTNTMMAATANQNRMNFGGAGGQMTPQQVKAGIARNMLARYMGFPGRQFAVPMDPSFQMNAQMLQQLAQQQAAVLAAVNAGANVPVSTPQSSATNAGSSSTPAPQNPPSAK